jgi:hypothetical protein
MATSAKKKKESLKDKDDLTISPVSDPKEEKAPDSSPDDVKDIDVDKDDKETKTEEKDSDSKDKEEIESVSDDTTPSADQTKETEDDSKDEDSEDQKEEEPKIEEETLEEKTSTSTDQSDDLDKPETSAEESAESNEDKTEDDSKDSSLDSDEKPDSDQAEEPVDTTLDTTSLTPTPEINFDDQSETGKEKGSVKKNKNLKGAAIALVLTVLVGGSLTGGILYSRSATNQDVRSKAAETVVDTTPIPTAEPTAEPTKEELDLSQYDIEIQNGSGVPGEAGVVDEILQEEGFNQADTANADSYDYQTTEVRLKEGTPKDVYEAIEEALNSDYDVELGDTLDDDSDQDIVIIVGAQI